MNEEKVKNLVLTLDGALKDYFKSIDCSWDVIDRALSEDVIKIIPSEDMKSISDTQDECYKNLINVSISMMLLAQTLGLSENDRKKLN